MAFCCSCAEGEEKLEAVEPPLDTQMAGDAAVSGRGAFLAGAGPADVDPAHDGAGGGEGVPLQPREVPPQRQDVPPQPPAGEGDTGASAAGGDGGPDAAAATAEVQVRTKEQGYAYYFTPYYRRKIAAQRTAAFTVVAGTLALLVYAVWGFTTKGIVGSQAVPAICKAREVPNIDELEANYVKLQCANYGLQTVVSAPLASWLLFKLQSEKLRHAAMFAAVAWLKASINFVYTTLLLLDGSSPFFMIIFTAIADFICYFMMLHRGWRNTVVLERGMLRKMGSQAIVRTVRFTIPGFLFVVAISVIDRFSGGVSKKHDALHYAWSFGVWYLVACMIALAALPSLAAFRAWRMVTDAARRAAAARLAVNPEDKEETPEARKAIVSCLFLMLVTISGLTSSFLSVFTRHVVLQRIWPLEDEVRTAWWICMSNLPMDFLDAYSNLALVLVSSGIFTGALESLHDDISNQERKAQRRKAIARSESRLDAQWLEVVEDLANRGFTLKALLDFYRGLGREYMPHFDPARSTTSDVVRAAIIPLSRARGCAYAKMMMDYKPTKPQVMITHAWGNRFRDLVSAAVADALGDHTFEFAARMLTESLDRLEELLATAQTLHRTYWICAFSVNQHAGICGAVFENDKVTNEKQAICECGAPKYFNSSPPLLADGRSIPCEMNKFDDMIKLLAEHNLGFYQVVAMDPDFITLERCWCVAEIVEAHKSWMHQCVEIHSVANLEEHLQDLDRLRVQDMKATRPDDVIDILAKIPDKESFNRTYRSIVADAMKKWSMLPEADRITRAARFWLHHNL